MFARTPMLFLATVLAMAACHRADDGGPVAASADAPSPEPTPRHHAKAPAESDAAVVITPADGAPARVGVEVVSSPQAVQRGLMYRQYLAADRGMLFLMNEERIHTFWMKNTLIPLDIIFIGRDMTVAGVAADAVPMSTKQVFVDKPSFYVLEVNAGWAKAHGISAGAKVAFEHVDQDSGS